jgi:uncharacterized protein
MKTKTQKIILHWLSLYKRDRCWQLIGLSVLSVLALCFTSPAQAGSRLGESPSFNCNQATTPTEHLICTAQDLSWLDRQMAQLYQAIREQLRPKARQSLIIAQQDWLQKRDQCQSNRDCTQQAYIDRLKTLAQTHQVTPHPNIYSYDNPNITGQLLLVGHLNGSVSAWIRTVSNPYSHLCQVSIEEARPRDSSSQQLIWKDCSDTENTIPKSETCQVILNLSDLFVDVEAQNCDAYCGQRAQFSGSYIREDYP